MDTERIVFHQRKLLAGEAYGKENGDLTQKKFPPELRLVWRHVHDQIRPSCYAFLCNIETMQ